MTRHRQWFRQRVAEALLKVGEWCVDKAVEVGSGDKAAVNLEDVVAPPKEEDQVTAAAPLPSGAALGLTTESNGMLYRNQAKLVTKPSPLSGSLEARMEAARKPW